jgi:single-strand DNA-binding protein
MALQRKEEMSELVTVAGLVATTPRHLVTQDGLPITSFRLAASHRKFDRALNKWIDGETNWFTITAFRQLAINTAGSVSKGERILVTGKLRVRDWDNGEVIRHSPELSWFARQPTFPNHRRPTVLKPKKSKKKS